jgi:hypothetical protein
VSKGKRIRLCSFLAVAATVLEELVNPQVLIHSDRTRLTVKKMFSSTAL